MSDEPTPPPVNENNATPPPVAGSWAEPPRDQKPTSSGAFGSLIPTSNPKALTSYYLGLFSIFPLIGLALGAAAIYLGSNGLRAVKEDPRLPGKTHAGVGIGCGIVGLLVNLLIVGLILAAVFSSSQARR